MCTFCIEDTKCLLMTIILLQPIVHESFVKDKR